MLVLCLATPLFPLKAMLCFVLKNLFFDCLHLFEIHKRCVAGFLFFGVFAIKHDLRLAAGGQVDCDSPAARVI